MRRLSDYQGEEAIELWADLIEPIAKIMADKKIAQIFQSGKPPVLAVKQILKTHKKEATEILNRLDPEEPINGINIVGRAIAIIMELTESEELKDFFGDAVKVEQ